MARKADPVTTYARAVTKGKGVVCLYARQVCERHLRDLARVGQPNFAYWFDVQEVLDRIAFFRLAKHFKGEWAGQPFALDPWQAFIIGSLFGWKRTIDNTRRFRMAYVEIPRGNGKSTLAAGVGINLAFFDGEPGADVYCAATKRDQALIVFDACKQMVTRSSRLAAIITCLKQNMHDPRTLSKLEPLGADADTMDGLRVHGAIIDEFHAHKTRALVDVLDSATGTRRQPLLFKITTAGFDRHSVCWQDHHYTTGVLTGLFQDETWFGFITTIDEKDDPWDERTWRKANPNLGVSVKLDDLRRKAEVAQRIPAAQTEFLRKHLNVWTTQAERWLDLDVWDACNAPVQLEDLAGRRCYVGIDLASTRDLTAVALFFPLDDGEFAAAVFFWVPADTVDQRVKRDRVPYDLWIEQGLIEVTEGNVTDYDIIRERLRGLAEQFQIVKIGYDRWNATQLATQLTNDGADVTPIGQGFSSLTAATKELERIVLGKVLRHGGHAVLRWNAANVAVEQDGAGNIKPSKKKSTERIDGISALVNAIDCYIREESGGSIYEGEGVLVV